MASTKTSSSGTKATSDRLNAHIYGILALCESVQEQLGGRVDEIAFDELASRLRGAEILARMAHEEGEEQGL